MQFVLVYQAEGQFHSKPGVLYRELNPAYTYIINCNFSIASQVAIMKTVLRLFFNTLITIDY